MAKQLRSGYTTGACAAAGVKAALLFAQGKNCDKVTIYALDEARTPLQIPIKSVQCEDDAVTAEVVKFSGDDPDITAGVSVLTTVRQLAGTGEIQFRAGKGIGTVTKPGLSVPVGEPAINPGPRRLIRATVVAVCGEDFPSLAVTIAIPAGVELCKKTLNPILGIEGGISVIGTTGLLKPMSEEAFKNSLAVQIDVALAAGYRDLIFAPGRIGERIALSWGLPQDAIVEISNFVGFMLETAADKGVRRVLLLGHIGKLSKVAAGIFYTHNRIADARLETIAAYAAAAGLPQAGTQAVLAANTTEDALAILRQYHLQQQVTQALAERASLRAERYLFGKMQVGTAMITMTGEPLGISPTAREIGEAFGWKLPASTKS